MKNMKIEINNSKLTARSPYSGFYADSIDLDKILGMAFKREAAISMTIEIGDPIGDEDAGNDD